MDTAYVGSNDGAPTTIGRINSTLVPIILDSGAVPNLISVKFLEKLRIDPSYPVQNARKVTLANGSQDESLGKIKGLEVNIKGTKHKIDALIFNVDTYDLLLGRKDLSTFKICCEFGKNSWWIPNKDGNNLPLPVSYDAKLTPNQLVISEEDEREIAQYQLL